MKMLFIRVASLFVVLFGTLPRGFAKVGQINYFWLVGKGALGEIFVYLVNLARKQCIHVNICTKYIFDFSGDLSIGAEFTTRLGELRVLPYISRYEKNPTLIFCARPTDPIFDGSGTRTKDIFDARLRGRRQKIFDFFIGIWPISSFPLPIPPPYRPDKNMKQRSNHIKQQPFRSGRNS